MFSIQKITSLYQNYIQPKLNSIGSNLYQHIFSPMYHKAASLKSWVFSLLNTGISNNAFPKTVRIYVQKSFMGHAEEMDITYTEKMSLEEFRKKNKLEQRSFYKDSDCTDNEIKTMNDLITYLNTYNPCLYCVDRSQ